MQNIESIQRAYDKGEISDVEYDNKLEKYSCGKISDINDILEDLVSIGRISTEQQNDIISILNGED